MDKKSPEAFRTISEVAEWLGVPAHVLRFWESRFGQVKPVKRAGGRRYYRPSDMELLGGIRKLLHEDGMTIRGVQKLLREKGVKYVAAMSPPIDQPADLRQLGESETAARAAPAHRDQTPAAAEPEIEDAVELEPEAAAPLEEIAQAQPFETAAPTPQATHRTEAAEAPETQVFAETAAETADGAASDDAAAVSGAPVPAGDESPLDSPEAVEFFAHDAEPDTTEGGDDALSNVFAGIGDGADARDSAAESTDAESLGAESPGAPDIAPIAAAPQPVAPMQTDADAARPAPTPAETPAADAPVPTHAPAYDAKAGDAKAGDATAGDAKAGEETGPVDAPAPAEPAQAEQTTGGTLPDGADATTEPAAPANASPPAPAPTPDGALPPDIAATASERDATGSTTREPAGSGPVERDLKMPRIGPDPEDDADITLPPAVAAELRRHRAGSGGARLNPALLQAFADRLEELSGRLGHSPTGRRPF